MMSALKPLPRSFYARDTHVVAQELLGKIMVRIVRRKIIAGRITEVEAYVGEDDLACHASRGRTARTEIMYGQPGHAYIYLIYGMHYCCNVVTDQKDFPAAVLIRSLEPLQGIATMRQLRQSADLQNMTTGPGKLTQALAITKQLNYEDLTINSRFFIADDGYAIPRHLIATSPRIGVAYAGACALYPWRYFIKDSPFVSNTRTSAYSK